MKINNRSTVYYLVFDKYEVTENSNLVTTEVINTNPIIIFKKLICNNNVEIYIENNKNIIINNIIYRECIKNDYIIDIIKNGKTIENINIKKGIYLRDLKPNEKIILQYNKIGNLNSNSLLSYTMIINNEINQIYISSKTKKSYLNKVTF